MPSKDPINFRSIAFWAINAPPIVYWLSNGFLLLPLVRYPSAIYAIDGVFVVGWPVAFLLWTRIATALEPKELGLSRTQGQGWDLLGTTVVCVISLIIATWVASGITRALLWRFDWIHQSSEVFYWESVIPNGVLGGAARVYLGVTAGIAEELYFRGFLKVLVYRYAPGSLARSMFLVLSGIAFGAIHWEGGLVRLVSTTLIGVTAGRLYLWAGSLWPLIIAHATVDLIFL